MPDLLAPLRCDRCPSRSRGVFGPLTPSQLADLNRCRGDNHYRKGEILFSEGDPCRGVYCVFEGLLKLYKTGSQGRPQIIGLAKPGSMVGHRSVLLNKPHSFSAEALGDARVCFINPSTFRSMVASHSSVSEALLKRLAEDLEAAEGRFIDVVEKRVIVRLARLLLTLCDAFGVPSPEGIRLPLFLTREEIAEMIGTTQETTIRLLSRLRRKGLLSSGEKSITIHDRDDLAGLADQPGETLPDMTGTSRAGR